MVFAWRLYVFHGIIIFVLNDDNLQWKTDIFYETNWYRKTHTENTNKRIFSFKKSKLHIARYTEKQKKNIERDVHIIMGGLVCAAQFSVLYSLQNFSVDWNTSERYYLQNDLCGLRGIRFSLKFGCSRWAE